MLALMHVVLLYTITTALISFVIKYYITTTSKKATSHSETEYAEIKTPAHKPHPTVAALQNLVVVDGAGSWPPKTSYGQAWPEALRPFHDIYLELVPSLSTAEISTDDLSNYQRCLAYRVKYKQILKERINLKQVEVLLSAAEKSATNILSREAWNGLFACIALSRHAFR